MLAEEILLRAKKNVFTNKAAQHVSKIRGDGLDLSEIRPYQFGDDVRHINFSASGKTGELQTNIFNEDKQINVVIIVMLSSSLYFGSIKLKSEVIAEIIALLGYSSIRQKNQTKLVFFAKNQKIVLPLNHNGDLLSAIKQMLVFDLRKFNADFQSLNDYLIQQKKSLVFVVSDFYEEHNFATIAHKNQINALMVRDNLEENPNFGTTLDLMHAYTGGVVESNIDKKRAKQYQASLIAKDNKLYAHFAKHKINFGKLYTHEDAFVKLNQILK